MQLPQTLNQTYNSTAADPLARLEPIDSVTRVVEDHLTVDATDPTKTAGSPSGTADPATTIFGTTATQVDSNDVAYTLGNTVLYVTGPWQNAEHHQALHDQFLARWPSDRPRADVRLLQ